MTGLARAERRPERRRRRLTDTSVATRLSLVALLVILVSLAVAGTVGLGRGNDLADELAEDRLIAVAAARGSTVESFLTSARREVAGLAISPATLEAIESFGDGFAALPAQSMAADTRLLTEYYLSEVAPQLEAVRGVPVGASFLIPESAAGARLQAVYTVPPEVEEGEIAIDPAVVIDPGDDSEYTAVHAALHPVYGEIAVRSGFDDLFLIDAERETIVYTVRKRIDLGTSLSLGPLSGSSLSTLVDSLADGPVGDSAAIVDFAPYAPAGDRPRLFVASPVLDEEGAVAGYIAASFTTEPFDAIMSGRGSWEGFGDTGEAYIVGGDGTMRTATRSYIARPGEFITEPDEPGPDDLTADQRRRIKATGTTALVQPVSRDVADFADVDVGTARTTNYRGVESATAFRRLAVEGLDWAVIAEASEDEINGPIEDYARNMLLAVALFVVAVTFVVVRWSDRLIAPIRAIAARLRAVSGGTATTDDSAEVELAANSPREYVELSATIDRMLERLAERRAEVDARLAERAELVAEFLPVAAVQRLQVGDDVLDHARNATVAVLSIDGIGDLIEALAEGEVREVLEAFVDRLDELALDFGLERVKITGLTYFAVCGVSRPYLDHVPRSVGFALAAAELVAELAEEYHSDFAVHAGVDSGSVAVGLTARQGLVYDVWGPPVVGASDLARSAPVGTVAISAAVREQLPSEFVLADGGDGTESSVVTGRVSGVTA